jgi:hypothetical protein
VKVALAGICKENFDFTLLSWSKVKKENNHESNECKEDEVIDR